MAEDDACNTCCQAWKDKCSKLKEKCSKLETGRTNLRKAISILEQQISILQAEKEGLEKANNSERAQAESEKEDKEKENAIRVTLENEISALKSELLLLKENQELVGRGVNPEVASLQQRILEAETEAMELKGLLQKEKQKVAEEKEKVDMEGKRAEKAMEKVKAEKKKASEEKRLLDIERKKDEKFRIQYETLRSEVDEAKSKLAMQTAKYEDEMRKLKAEKELSKKERERADKEMAKAEDLRKLAEANQKKAMDETSRADHLSQHLNESKKRLDKFEKEFSGRGSIKKLVEIPGNQHVEKSVVKFPGKVCSGITSRETNLLEECKKQEVLEKKIRKVKKQVKSEMKKAQEQMRVAEAYKSNAMDEKNRSDRLSYQLDATKQRLEEIQNKFQELFSLKVFEFLDPASGGILQEATAEIKFLRKQLKFEKMRVKHASEVSKMEMDRNQILRKQIHCIKQEFLHFSKRLETLDQGLVVQCGNMNDLEKVKNSNLEEECFYVQPSLKISRTENEFVKPTCTNSIVGGGSGHWKPTVLIPPVTGEICTGPLTGTDSSLEFLLRSSSRNMLQTSALNSSSASFSDRPLVGSQEKGTSSITTPSTSSLSDVTRKGFDEKLGTGAENSVGSPPMSGATERNVRQMRRKRKRFPDVVDSIERLRSVSRKWQPRLVQNLTMIQGMLSGESLKPSEEEQYPVPKKQKASNMSLEMLPAAELKSKLETLCTEISEGCKTALTFECNKNAPELRGSKDDLVETVCHSTGDFELLDQDVMALMDLDNGNDEKRFRIAVKEPVSPLSPSLRNIQFPCMEATDNEMQISWSVACVSRAQEKVLLSCDFDVMNMEINSNERMLKSLETCRGLSFGMCANQNDSKEGIECSGIGNSGIESSGQIEAADKMLVAPKDTNLTSEWPGSGCSISLRYCIVSSNNIENGSVCKIFHACSRIMSQISGTFLNERLILDILVSLQKADGLSVGERASVLFSLLLHYIPEIAVGNFRSFSDTDFLKLVDSFSQQWHAVLSDVATRKLFLESCDVGELFALIESFLLNGTILVHDDESFRRMRGCGSVSNDVPGDKFIYWSVAAASTNLLFTSGMLLASICVSIDQIGVICDISYHLLCARKISISFLLKLLHAFAYLCGPKYFTLEDYGLVMYVLKSLVAFLERLNSSTTENFSCIPSVEEKLFEISACSACPFLEDVASVDSVVLLLLEKLQIYALSVNGKWDHCVSLPSSNNVLELPGIKVADIPLGDEEAAKLNFETNQELSCFLDIISLVELVANTMAWDWTFRNLVLGVIKIVDSYLPGSIIPATIALLGQLGRIGVDAKGYEDSQVVILRNWFVGFVCSTKFKTYSLPVQLASASALIGLVDRPSIDLVDSNFDSSLSDSQSAALRCLSKWFSSLSKEEQSSFRSLHL